MERLNQMNTQFAAAPSSGKRNTLSVHDNRTGKCVKGPNSSLQERTTSSKSLMVRSTRLTSEKLRAKPER